MAIDNLISVSFTEEELNAIDNALASIEVVIKNKCIKFTPEERKKYAKVGRETEDWIAKVREYMLQSPELILPHIDTDEYYKDYDSRLTLLPRIRRLENIYNLFEDTNLLIGNDLYNNAISYYKGLKAERQNHISEAKCIYFELTARFPGRPKAFKLVES